VKALSERLGATHEQIEIVRERAEAADIDVLQADLNTLSAIRNRRRPEIAALCDAYLEEKRLKSETEQARDTAREALNEYRNEVFPVPQLPLRAKTRGIWSFSSLWSCLATSATEAEKSARFGASGSNKIELRIHSDARDDSTAPGDRMDRQEPALHCSTHRRKIISAGYIYTPSVMPGATGSRCVSEVPATGRRVMSGTAMMQGSATSSPIALHWPLTVAIV
jgi:hypothetical protein